MRKDLLFSLPFLLFSSLVADSIKTGDLSIDEERFWQIEQRLSSLEKATDTTHANTYASQYDIDIGAVRAENRGRFYGQAELLYWKIIEEDLSIAIKNPVPLVGSSPATEGVGIFPNFQWEPGFRFSLGVNSCDHKTDIAFRWTHNRATVHDNLVLPQTIPPALVPTPVFLGIWENKQTPLSPFRFADAKWNLKMNLIDLTIGRLFVFSDAFNLRSFAGIQAVSIQQDFNLVYSLVTATPPYESQIFNQNGFRGMGPMIGSDIAWLFWKGFSLVGTGSAAFHYGRVKQTQHELRKATANTDPLVTFEKISDSFNSLKVAFNLLFGVRYDGSLMDEKLHLGLQAGWEILSLQGQNEWRQFTGSGGHHGALNSQGLNLKLAFGF